MLIAIILTGFYMHESVTNIFLVRHGQTTWNLEKRWQGSKNSDLTQLGINQINHSKISLEKYSINHAFVSPAKRALDSMNILLSHRKIEPVVLDDLREITLGAWEGKTQDEVAKLNPTQYFNYWNKPDLFFLPNAESYEELQTRVINVLDHLFKTYEGSNILVVSHGVSIKVALAYYSNVSIKKLAQINDPQNAEVVRLQKIDDLITVV